MYTHGRPKRRAFKSGHSQRRRAPQKGGCLLTLLTLGLWR